MDDYWKGSLFGNPENLIGGKRMLVLGESHYSSQHEVGEHVPDMTVNVLTHHCRPKARGFRFFRKVERIVLKQAGLTHVGHEHAAQFWQSVVFANYIPVVAAKRPRQRPPEHLWNAEAAGRYRRIIADEKIDMVLVCGKETFLRAPCDVKLPGRYRMMGLDCSARLVSKGEEAAAMAAYIHHPASFGWSYEKNMPAIRFLFRTRDAA